MKWESRRCYVQLLFKADVRRELFADVRAARYFSMALAEYVLRDCDIARYYSPCVSYVTPDARLYARARADLITRFLHTRPGN